MVIGSVVSVYALQDYLKIIRVKIALNASLHARPAKLANKIALLAKEIDLKLIMIVSVPTEPSKTTFLHNVLHVVINVVPANPQSSIV